MKYHIWLVSNISFFFIFMCPLVEAEVYSATADLEQLLFTDSEIAKFLESYLAKEEERLKSIKWLKNQCEKLYMAAKQDQDSFLTNPVNAYLLVKRLSEDWETIGRLIEEPLSKALMENIAVKDLLFPGQDDLEGAATALLRLQDTYLIDASQLARGEIEGSKSIISELAAGDCYQIGYQAVTLKDYKRAIQWMQEALVKVEQEEIKTASKTSILEFLAHCAFQLKSVKRAIKLTEDIIAIEPHHPRAFENLIYYQSVWNPTDTEDMEEHSQEYASSYSVYDTIDEDDSQSPRELKRAYIPAFDNYEKLCRGERTETQHVGSHLKCRYWTNNNHYLLLQPIKEEVLSLDPFICMYHDVISDKDIELFKKTALPQLNRATVTNPETGVLESAPFRVGKTAWLQDIVHPRIAHASQVIEDITSLETDTAEELHIVNYGMGGHYEPHLDFEREEETIDRFTELGTGNRIATWIYYLSDVDAGGATVFPEVGVSIKPRKGSAAFWYNLRRNGEGDLNTLHAACPVLSGSKWVANKWLHEIGNEFRRKCSLNYSE